MDQSDLVDERAFLTPYNERGYIERHKDGFMKLRTKLLEIPGEQECWQVDVARIGESGFGVAVLPFLNEREVLLVKQYRYGVNEVMLELVQGGACRREDYRMAARREMSEEIGYKGKLHELFKGAIPLGGCVDHRIIVYTATNLEKVCEPTLNSKERLVPVVKRWDDLYREVASGQHKDMLLHLAVTHYAMRVGYVPGARQESCLVLPAMLESAQEAQALSTEESVRTAGEELSQSAKAVTNELKRRRNTRR